MLVVAGISLPTSTVETHFAEIVVQNLRCMVNDH